LNNIGIEDPDNYILSWTDTTNLNNYQQIMMIASLLNNWDQYRESNCKDIKAWKTHMPEWSHKYRNLFSRTKSERMPLWKSYNHPIEFEKDTTLFKLAKIYPLSVLERDSLDFWIDEELRKSYIQLSISSIAAPFFFIKKYDKSLCPVMNYKTLNRITKSCYLISWLIDLIESLSHVSMFTKIDLRWEYNNIHIKKKGEWKIAFITK